MTILATNVRIVISARGFPMQPNGPSDPKISCCLYKGLGWLFSTAYQYVVLWIVHRYLPVANGENAVLSFTSSEREYHRSGMNTSALVYTTSSVGFESVKLPSIIS
jgi:hypothetical protein